MKRFCTDDYQQNRAFDRGGIGNYGAESGTYLLPLYYLYKALHYLGLKRSNHAKVVGLKACFVYPDANQDGYW